MKSIFGPVLGALLMASFPAGAAAQQAPAAQSDQAAELAEARAIIDIMLPPASRQQMMEEMTSNIIGQMRKSFEGQGPADPGLKAIVDQHLDKLAEAQKPLLRKHMPDLVAAMATAYSNEFSLAELKDIRAFATSPSGRHYLSRSLAMVSDPAIAKVNQSMFTESQKLALESREELKAKILAYWQAHPEAMPKDEDDAAGK